ncbi:hypothetical protein GFS33_05605 [Sulfolobus sp. E11-6]|nr:hypothetical protein GFS33_05605 [Sulfolobus sp. E11-6]
MFKVNYLVLGGDLVGKGVFLLYKRGDEYYDIDNNLISNERLEEIKRHGFIYTYLKIGRKSKI